MFSQIYNSIVSSNIYPYWYTMAKRGKTQLNTIIFQDIEVYNK